MALKALATIIILLVFLAADAGAEARPGEKLRDYTLSDQDGKPVRLSDFRGRPLVLSFVYSTCTHTCGTLTASLDEAFKGQGLGKRFSALTVGFDHERDTPSAMKEYGLKFVDDFQGWTFASGDGAAIGALTAEAGFYYKKTAEGLEHPNMALVIGPQGRIFKRLYGNEIEAGPLMEAVTASLDPEHEGYSAREKGFLGLLKYVCYTYDEESGKYRLDGTFLMIVALGLIVQASLVGFVFYIRYSLRKKGK